MCVQPRFDWSHPGELTEEDVDRLAQGIWRSDAVIDRNSRLPYAGFCGEGTSYRHPPLTRYQMRAREGLNPDDDVVYHYTGKSRFKIVDR